MANISINQVGVTEMQERTWGRVYVDYTENGTRKYIFKNWIYFAEKTYKGTGSFEHEPAYTWFYSRRIADVITVLQGGLDNMNLTGPRYKQQYGTPSRILTQMLDEIAEGAGIDVINRRNWYLRGIDGDEEYLD